MTETIHPTQDPADFDLDSWLVGGHDHRPQRHVTVYRDLALNAEAQAAIDRLDAYDKAQATPVDKDGKPEEELGGDPERDALEARVIELFDRMKATTATVTVWGLTAAETKAVTDKYSTDDPLYEYAVIARAGRLEGRELTMTQWQKFHETIGQGQWRVITAAYSDVTLNVPKVDAPFSVRSSQRVTGD